MGDNKTSSSTKNSPNNDPTSPYYIHPSDLPRQMHVNDELNDGNYGMWVQEMENFLFAKNKIGFVDGSMEEPEEEIELAAWKRCDAMVKGWLTTAMEKNVRYSVRYARTASAIWNDLKERFVKESAPRAYELKRALTMTRQESMSVSEYYTKLRRLWDEIDEITPISSCSCGGSKKLMEVKERERLYEFLMGLNETFNTVRTQILTTKPIMAIGTAYHLVAEDEQNKLITATHKPNLEATAFQTTGRMQKSVNQKCPECGRQGHSVENCFEVIGYPDWWKERQATREKGPRGTETRGQNAGRGRNFGEHGASRGNQNRANNNSGRGADKQGERGRQPRVALAELGLSDDQYAKLMNLLTPENEGSSNNFITANMAGKGIFTKPWIIDSGATEHISFDKSLLHNFRTTENNVPVRIPNGDIVPVQGVGSVILKNGLQLKNVLYIPDFKCNLLSVSRLTKDLNCTLTFSSRFCVIQDSHSRKLIGAGKGCDGLYCLEPIDDCKTALLTSVDSMIWHKRLGHASNIKLKQLNFIDKNFDCNNLHCDSCLRAKQTRPPFGDSYIKSTDCFELIHCDIWGGYKIASLTGAKYFLSIVDDYSRAVWVYLVVHKSDVADCLIAFYHMIFTQFGKCIKRIRSDNGGEFQSHRMLDFYAEKGILLETSCVYTPQQNGVVERKHRHILETARALRFQSNLPIKFWGECVLTAVYLINRLPSRAIDNKTPFELLFGKAPDYLHLRVFGCLVYAKNNKKGLDKFDERGRPCVFLGYPSGQKGYRVFDLADRRIYVTRDVKFVEHVFPFSDDVKNTGADFSQAPKSLGDPMPDNIDGVNEGPETLPNSAENAQLPNSTDAIPCEHGDRHAVLNDEIPHGDLRRSSRVRAQPKRLQEFEVDIPTSIDHTQPPAANSVSSTVHPLSRFVSYKRFSPSHRAFLAAITNHDEPKSFKDAVKDPDWRDAMQNEISALEKNGTWTLEHLPPDKRAIDSKWVYKIKYKPNGEIERYKARLVARGFTQIEGIDFHETFAPVAKVVTVRCLLAVAVKKGWAIHQLDVNNAFLHGDLTEEVYMKIPQGFAKEGDKRVCRLRRSLYGLKQASRNWHHKFTEALVGIGFRQSRADHSLFVLKQRNICVFALVYVDDVILVGNSDTKIQVVKDYLDNTFSIKDLGSLKYFLGIEVARTPDGLVLSQRKYVLDILEECGLQGSRPSPIPMEQNLKLTDNKSSPKVDASRFRRLVGRLLYLQVTRPDIAYAVNILSQFLSDPREVHLDAAFRIVRYLKGTVGQGIFFPAKGDVQLEAFCDSDWGSCLTTRRSRTGFFLTLGGAPISWRTKKQSVVSRSSAEAEYRAMASTVSEVLWVRWLLHDLDAQQVGSTTLYCDNQAALHIASNPVFHERTKHVEMDCYFVRERVESKEIKPMFISTKNQIADLLTKALASPSLLHLLSKLGVCNLHAPT